jgi:hypothetical protein
VNDWRSQKVDDLRRRCADLLARRAVLVSDPAQANTVRQLDDQITEHCAAIAAIERKLKATTP